MIRVEGLSSWRLELKLRYGKAEIHETERPNGDISCLVLFNNNNLSVGKYYAQHDYGTILDRREQRAEKGSKRSTD